MLGIGNGIDLPSHLAGLYSGLSVDFDGTDDYIDYGNSSDILGTGDVSMAAWINLPSAYPGSNAISEQVNVLNRWMFGWTADGRITFLYVIGGTSTLLQSDVCFVGAPNTATGWIHIAFTYDRDSEIKFYLNGSPVTTDSGSGSVNTTDLSMNGDVYSARWTSSGSPVYGECKLNDVAIWDAVLTPTQITKIYNNGYPLDHIGTQDVGASNLIHWWRMGDGPGDGGTTIADQVGSVDGTLTNGASIVRSAPNNEP